MKEVLIRGHLSMKFPKMAKLLKLPLTQTSNTHLIHTRYIPFTPLMPFLMLMKNNFPSFSLHYPCTIHLALFSSINRPPSSPQPCSHTHAKIDGALKMVR